MNAKDGTFEQAHAALSSLNRAHAAGFVWNGEWSVAKPRHHYGKNQKRTRERHVIALQFGTAHISLTKKIV